MTAAAGPRVRVLFIGTGSFAVPALRALAGLADVALVGVVTAPPRAAGRRAELSPSPVASAAVPLGVGPVLAPERLRRPDAVASVLDLSPELIVLADYGQLVPAALLGVPLGALNLHPSLLPRHRGASPIPATILAGDDVTGVTLIRLDDGLDTGPIVATDDVELGGNERAPDLEAELADRAASLLVGSLPAYRAGILVPVPQPPAGATLTRPLRREDGRVDPSQPAASLERQVRAFMPWPGSWLLSDQGRLAIRAARVSRALVDLAPGAVVAADGLLVLATADGVLELTEVQPAGKAPMSAEAFLRGRPRFRATVAPGPPREPIERPVG